MKKHDAVLKWGGEIARAEQLVNNLLRRMREEDGVLPYLRVVKHDPGVGFGPQTLEISIYEPPDGSERAGG